MRKTNKEYSAKFYEKHKERIQEKKSCEICGGQYDYNNKSHHIKTKKHVQCLNLIEKFKEEKEQKSQ